jgi:tetraacyldisaccharide-1-P 4'-kinase
MSTEKDAVKLAASRRQNNNKIDLELAKLMKEKKE